mmetsp:Transcript_21554/g.34042  ORF Transcript_21554/g.34042 Transcript_21554/m.34042 type:complete len:152 (-) Transcript_21554:167-622(-)|eukprot:1393686-Amorphochlora_amoeboformis.AAC.1
MSFPPTMLDYSSFVLLPNARNALPGMRFIDDSRDPKPRPSRRLTSLRLASKPFYPKQRKETFDSKVHGQSDHEKPVESRQDSEVLGSEVPRMEAHGRPPLHYRSLKTLSSKAAKYGISKIEGGKGYWRSPSPYRRRGHRQVGGLQLVGAQA